jgi:hypothetical protein
VSDNNWLLVSDPRGLPLKLVDEEITRFTARELSYSLNSNGLYFLFGVKGQKLNRDGVSSTRFVSPSSGAELTLLEEDLGSDMDYYRLYAEFSGVVAPLGVTISGGLNNSKYDYSNKADKDQVGGWLSFLVDRGWFDYRVMYKEDITLPYLSRFGFESAVVAGLVPIEDDQESIDYKVLSFGGRLQFDVMDFDIEIRRKDYALDYSYGVGSSSFSSTSPYHIETIFLESDLYIDERVKFGFDVLYEIGKEEKLSDEFAFANIPHELKTLYIPARLDLSMGFFLFNLSYGVVSQDALYRDARTDDFNKTSKNLDYVVAGVVVPLGGYGVELSGSILNITNQKVDIFERGYAQASSVENGVGDRLVSERTLVVKAKYSF